MKIKKVERIADRILSGDYNIPGITFLSDGSFFDDHSEEEVSIHGHVFFDGVFLVVDNIDMTGEYKGGSFSERALSIYIKSNDGIDFKASNVACSNIPICIRSDRTFAQEMKLRYDRINDNYEELVNDIKIGMRNSDIEEKYGFEHIINESYSLKRK